MDATIAQLAINRLAIVPFMHPVSHPAFAVATALRPSQCFGKWICRRPSDAQSVPPIQTDPPDAVPIEWLLSYSDIVNYNTISQASLFWKFFLAPLFPSRFAIRCETGYGRHCAPFLKKSISCQRRYPRLVDPQLAPYCRAKVTTKRGRIYRNVTIV